MLLEALVITVCVNGYDGCSQSTSAYYQHNKELQAISKRVERYGKELTKNHEWLVYAATPIYAIASQKPAKFMIYKGTTLNVDPWKQSLGIQWSY
jgi:hypothetical protein